MRVGKRLTANTDASAIVDRSVTRFLPLVLVASVVTGCATGRTAVVTERTCGTVRVPVTTEVDGRRLALNGMAVREVALVQVDLYVGALYLEHRTRDVGTFLGSNQHKRLELHFVHDIGRDSVLRFLRWGFSGNPEELRSEYEAQADWIEQFFTDYVVGDVVAFDYRPGHGITMSKNGQTLGYFDGDEFAKLFFGVFVGPRASNRALREGLVGGVCNE